VCDEVVRVVRLLTFVTRISNSAVVESARPSRIGEVLASRASQLLVVVVLAVLVLSPMLSNERVFLHPWSLALSCAERLDSDALAAFVAEDLSRGMDRASPFAQPAVFARTLFLQVETVHVVSLSLSVGVDWIPR